MVQDEARSGSRPVPVEFGCKSRLYKFWSSQMDSFTELASGSSVSTLTALAMTSVLTLAVEPPDPKPAGALLPPQAAAVAARASRPMALIIRDGVGRTMSHSHFVDCRQLPQL